MKFVLDIRLGNAAMTDSQDLSDLLGETAERVLRGNRQGTLLDDNGNLVGSWSFEDDDQ